MQVKLVDIYFFVISINLLINLNFIRLFPHVLPYLYPVTLIVQHGSLLTTVALALERYVTTCHPHWWENRDIMVYGYHL